MNVFAGVSNINKPDITENIRDNVVSFIDWGFLNTSGFYNVNIPSSGGYGGNAHILKNIVDPRYVAGTVWEGFRANWVWESGIFPSPIINSGVFVGSTFYPTNSGHYIDYENGKVVFSTAKPISSVVQTEYSFKIVKVVDARRVNFFRQLEQGSFRTDTTNYLVSSGIKSVLGDTRLQLPMVAIEMPISTSKKPYELGDNISWHSTDILLHIVGEDDSIVTRIADTLDRQKEHTIYMYDSYQVGMSGKYPLDYRGARVGTLNYSNLVDDYRYTSGVGQGKLRISDSHINTGTWLSSKIYMKTVRWTTEVILLNG